MNKIGIISRKRTPLKSFLEEQDYLVALIEEGMWRVSRDQLDVFLKQEGNILYFEVDLGSTEGITSQEFYKDLLILNTKILPVSIGVDHSGKEERLILIESREVENLDDNEILSVFESLGIAYLKAEDLLSRYIKK